jgi:hypothetical protein
MIDPGGLGAPNKPVSDVELSHTKFIVYTIMIVKHLHACRTGRPIPDAYMFMYMYTQPFLSSSLGFNFWDLTRVSGKMRDSALS